MPPVSGFVQRLGAQLFLQGRPFRIAGSNNYYLAYVDESALNAALDLAESFGMNVLRTWAFLDSEKPPAAGEICFQYWDAAANEPRIQEGEDGLVRLDRAIATAGERGFRLILPLTNNWNDFGGMPQYVQWFGMNKKNRFYTDERCRSAYQNWACQVVTRRNTITGRLYSEEPAILAWELANEPRCEGIGGTRKLIAWVEEMSHFMRGLDANHLIAVGDEGSCDKLLEVEAITLGTYHLYGETMSKETDPAAFGLDWIRKHSDAGARTGKPMLLEEYGVQDVANRNRVYDVWLRALEELEQPGALVWMTGQPKGIDPPYQPDPYVISDLSDAPAIEAYARRMQTITP